MHTTATPTRLLPHQTRLIHASEGMRLRVVTGRFWLTQPNATQDLFLGPGDCIDLMQDWVVVGADASLRDDDPAVASYSSFELQVLMPIEPKRGIRQAFMACAVWLRSRVAGAQSTNRSGAPQP